MIDNLVDLKHKLNMASCRTITAGTCDVKTSKKSSVKRVLNNAYETNTELQHRLVSLTALLPKELVAEVWKILEITNEITNAKVDEERDRIKVVSFDENKLANAASVVGDMIDDLILELKKC
jgi:hypothetical protein